MRASRNGFLAMTDAVIFIIVLMTASALIVGAAGHNVGDDKDASGFLQDLLSSEVRMSDLSDGDDSLVRLSDMIALEMQTGEKGRTSAYVEELLHSFSRGRACCLELELTIEDPTVRASFGELPNRISMEASRTVPVSTGGTLGARLVLSS